MASQAQEFVLRIKWFDTSTVPGLCVNESTFQVPRWPESTNAVGANPHRAVVGWVHIRIVWLWVLGKQHVRLHRGNHSSDLIQRVTFRFRH